MLKKSPVFFNVQAPLAALVYKNEAFLKMIFCLAALSFLTTLRLPYQGEEGVYTITSLEMWFNKEWFRPIFYGGNYGRPPLFNWLIIPLASTLGFEQVLLASRSIASLASVATALVLFWLIKELFKNGHLAWFAAAIFLSGDLLFRRGWLAYADPVFAFFVFAATSLLWVGVEKKNLRFLALANLCLISAFLTKALTAYCFYGIAVFVLFWKHENRRFLFSPLSLLLHLSALLFPLIWNLFFTAGAHGDGMLVDILSKLSAAEFKNYFLKVLSYPFYLFIYWLPTSALLVFFFWQNKKQKLGFLQKLKLQDPNFMIFIIGFWILLLNILPYWLAPQNRIRYILPLYPLFALCAAYIIYIMGEKAVHYTTVLLGVCVIIKFCFGFFGYSMLEQKMRGDYNAIAQDILQTTQGQPLCINDDSATGLSVTAELDVLRLPEAPLVRCTNQQGLTQKEGFFLVNNASEYKNTVLFHEYLLGRNKLYLLCKGKACQK